jgi:selenocysteine lyase/cysteine desulfurase
MNRQTFVERLRAWAARADNEVAFSAGTAKRTWQGEAEVLRATANVAISSGGAPQTPGALRAQLIADRQKTLKEWEEATDPDEVAFLSGQTTAYDLVLTLLKDADLQWVA